MAADTASTSMWEKRLVDAGLSANKTEREGWIRAQKHAFTAWVNFQLKEGGADSGLHVADLFADLRSGLTLVALLRVLSGAQPPRKVNANVSMRIMAQDNLQIFFDMLAAQGVRTENLGPTDVYEGNEMLILGLIWTLILRFGGGARLSPPSNDDGRGQTTTATTTTDDDDDSSGPSTTAAAAAVAIDKDELLAWCQERCAPYGVMVDNFTTSWQDSAAFSALAAACVPGASFDDERQSPMHTLQTAFDSFDSGLGVPPMLVAELLLPPYSPDERSNITYLSAIRSKAACRPAILPTDDDNNTDAHVQPDSDAKTKTPLEFDVSGSGLRDCRAGQQLEVLVKVTGDGARPDRVRLALVDEDGDAVAYSVEHVDADTLRFVYTPTSTGAVSVRGFYAKQTDNDDDDDDEDDDDDDDDDHMVELFDKTIVVAAGPPARFSLTSNQRVAAVDAPAEFVLAVTDAHGNAVPYSDVHDKPLRVEVVHLSEPPCSLPPALANTGADETTISFCPEHPGRYEVRVYYDEVCMACDQVEALVPSKTFAADSVQSVATALQRAQLAVQQVHKDRRVPLTAGDVARLQVESSAPVDDVQLHFNEASGQVEVSYVPLEAGELELRLLYDGVPATRANVLVQPAPPAHFLLDVTSAASSALPTRGRSCRYALRAVDARRNDTDFVASKTDVVVIGPDGQPLAHVRHAPDSPDDSCDLLTGEFTPPLPGDYTVRVVYDDGVVLEQTVTVVERQHRHHQSRRKSTAALDKINADKTKADSSDKTTADSSDKTTADSSDKTTTVSSAKTTADSSAKTTAGDAKKLQLHLTTTNDKKKKKKKRSGASVATPRRTLPAAEASSSGGAAASSSADGQPEAGDDKAKAKAKLVRVYLEDEELPTRLGMNGTYKSLPYHEDTTFEQLHADVVKQLKKGVVEAETLAYMEQQLQAKTYCIIQTRLGGGITRVPYHLKVADVVRRSQLEEAELKALSLSMSKEAAVKALQTSATFLGELGGTPMTVLMKKALQKKDAQRFQLAQPEKVVVRLLAGRNLAAKDANGLSDPYCRLLLNNQKWRSRTQYKTLEPVFDESFEFGVRSVVGQLLYVEVWDYDRLGKHDFMGCCTVDVAALVPGQPAVAWHPLRSRDGKDDRNVSGEVHLSLTYVDTKARTSAASSQQLLPGLPGGEAPAAAAASTDDVRLSKKKAAVMSETTPNKLNVSVLRGVDLVAKDAGGTSDPFCKLKCYFQKQKTRIIDATLNPEWNESFSFGVPEVFAAERLVVDVFDHDLVGKPDFMGRVVVPLSEFLAGETTIQGFYPVQPRSGKKDRVSGGLHLKLDFLKNVAEEPEIRFVFGPAPLIPVLIATAWPSLKSTVGATAVVKIETRKVKSRALTDDIMGSTIEGRFQLPDGSVELVPARKSATEKQRKAEVGRLAISYKFPLPGQYTATIVFNGQQLQTKPAVFTVRPDRSTPKVKIQ